MLEDAIQFIDGDPQNAIEELILKREHAASMLEFERAAAIQKRVERLQKVSIYLEVHQFERGGEINT